VAISIKAIKRATGKPQPLRWWLGYPKYRANSRVSGIEKPDPSMIQVRSPCQSICVSLMSFSPTISSSNCQTASGNRLRASQNAEAFTNEPHK
jgi:hypothetical protein